MKWWLLAIPHLLVRGVLTGGGSTWSSTRSGGDGTTTTSWGPSLLGLLVLVTAVALLFTGRYRPGLFALIMGINRWVYRVLACVLLTRDEYPPFRLGQGPAEPPPRKPAARWAPPDQDRPPDPQEGQDPAR